MAILAASIAPQRAPVSQSPRQMAAQGNADALLDQSGSPNSWRSIMENPSV